MIRHLQLKIREGLRKNWDVYEGFHELQDVKKYLRKLNNIQRVEYEEKFKSFIKTTFSTKKSIITIISRTRIITITFIKLTISIIFVKVKVEDAKKLICYNYNQINHVKRDCFQLDKKIVRIYAMRINSNDDL